MFVYFMKTPFMHVWLNKKNKDSFPILMEFFETNLERKMTRETLEVGSDKRKARQIFEIIKIIYWQKCSKSHKLARTY